MRLSCSGLFSSAVMMMGSLRCSPLMMEARTERFDLLLLDCRMPDGGAMHVLAQLRSEAQAASTESVAVATSAELTRADRRRLLAAGFSDVLLKPCTLADLQRVLALD